MKILIVNGPNLNLLGSRETQIYGNVSFADFLTELKSKSSAEISYFQSNVEGELINVLQDADADGIILNAGGYTHTSVALRDCIAAISTSVVEVHISNITARESFRHESMLSPVCAGCIFGFGMKGYEMALGYFETMY
ncbi:MAG: type II 3-dehydroquinate dehydratase [Crocinitomicaceae bacterium]|jgi:3-dehydroquinate dehydratase II|nr:type II 3-dehydroquinate dehydratase [Crocinitomicaceae bacterium]MDP4760928.1 type II 3-dehydroquinate dehydratase [Crocinitomicaceae bacterium]